MGVASDILRRKSITVNILTADFSCLSAHFFRVLPDYFLTISNREWLLLLGLQKSKLASHNMKLVSTSCLYVLSAYKLNNKLDHPQKLCCYLLPQYFMYYFFLSTTKYKSRSVELGSSNFRDNNFYTYTHKHMIYIPQYSF